MNEYVNHKRTSRDSLNGGEGRSEYFDRILIWYDQVKLIIFIQMWRKKSGRKLKRMAPF